MNQMPLNCQFGLWFMTSYLGADQLKAKSKMYLSLLMNLLIMVSSFLEIIRIKVKRRTPTKIKIYTQIEYCLSLELEVLEPNSKIYKKKC